MIIGNNNGNNMNKAFNTKLNAIKENANNTNYTPPVSNETIKHRDILDKNDMNDKAFSMLQERLNNGLITIEEFNKKCTQLGKRYK